MRKFLLSLLLLLPLAAPAAPDLVAAIRAHDAAATRAALEAGADPEAGDNWGRTPLLIAAQLRNTEAVRQLLARKVDVNAANRNDITPLIAAAQTGNVEAARLLLEAGANPNLRDNLGWSALTWAKNRKQDEIAALLVAKGADDLAPPPPGATRAPRHAAFTPVLDPGRAIRGDRRAPVTVFEYTDFQCPYCRAGAATMEELLARYEGEVRVVVKHLPLPALHAQAIPAARYFEALALQDEARAWAFHDRVFREQGQLKGGDAWMRQVALELGADAARLEADLKGPVVQARIERDLAESGKLGFDGVPVYVVAGEVIEGAQPASSFVAVIEAARRR